MASDSKLRQLKIKTNVVKRYETIHFAILYYRTFNIQKFSLIAIIGIMLRSFDVVPFRIGKEVKMYEKEAQSLEEKVKKMESEGKDEYDIRKQVSLECICYIFK